jgi:cobalt transporter subunit CbtB
MQALTAHFVNLGVVTRHLPALALLGFGVLMIYGVGFSVTQQVHNAAHDTRHAAGFPCH